MIISIIAAIVGIILLIGGYKTSKELNYPPAAIPFFLIGMLIETLAIACIIRSVVPYT